MSLYLDASVLVPLTIVDPHTSRAEQYFNSSTDLLVISDFAAAELTSGLARLVRMSDLKADDARNALAGFDNWAANASQRVAIGGRDIRTAETFLRRFDIPLTTPDMLHIAVAQRLGCDLATFDLKMKSAAVKLGVHVAEI